MDTGKWAERDASEVEQPRFNAAQELRAQIQARWPRLESWVYYWLAL